MVDILNWVHETYIIKKKHVPFNDDVCPLDGCPKWERFLSKLKIYQDECLQIRDYKIDNEWIQNGFDVRFFDTPDNKDGRLYMDKTMSKLYEKCSVELLPPPESKSDDLTQTTLYGYL
jgi:hypothetical protein